MLYPGEMEENHDTFSFMELLQLLDYNKYDVTLLTGGSGDEPEQRICSLDQRVRVLYRGQPENGTCEEKGLYAFSKGKDPSLAAFYKREAKRLFGDARFDYVINLSSEKNVITAMLPFVEHAVYAEYGTSFVDITRISQDLGKQQQIHYLRPGLVYSRKTKDRGGRTGFKIAFGAGSWEKELCCYGES